jgi:hypothetical protein
MSILGQNDSLWLYCIRRTISALSVIKHFALVTGSKHLFLKNEDMSACEGTKDDIKIIHVQ